MKQLTDEQKLALLKRALNEWTNEHDWWSPDATTFGFCYYFRTRCNLGSEEYWILIPELYAESKSPMGRYHFESIGRLPAGREDRVKALIRTIKKLKRKIKNRTNETRSNS